MESDFIFGLSSTVVDPNPSANKTDGTSDWLRTAPCRSSAGENALLSTLVFHPRIARAPTDLMVWGNIGTTGTKMFYCGGCSSFCRCAVIVCGSFCVVGGAACVVRNFAMSFVSDIT